MIFATRYLWYTSQQFVKKKSLKIVFVPLSQSNLFKPSLTVLTAFNDIFVILNFLHANLF
jgi:hypothetical protein